MSLNTEQQKARELLTKISELESELHRATLRHEAGKKRQLKPLRSLVSDAPTAKYLQTAKPIWMMSPSAVSASLGGSSIKFDYVVFDESSQLRVEHSLPALARAKQVIAFGDEHQLPPTSFFFTSDVQEEDEEEEVALDILSSLSTVFTGAARATLNFHYRSRYEELIAFSNNFVYENRLITSPNPRRSSEAVKFVYVEDGVFSDQMNTIEAKEVARICIEEAVRHPEQSLGVIAFSRRQEVAIRDAVLELVRGNAEAEILLDEERDVDEPFFIKNLENVQGDERDRIILSGRYPIN